MTSYPEVHPSLCNVTSRFRDQRVIPVQKNIGSPICGDARGHYLAHGLIAILTFVCFRGHFRGNFETRIFRLGTTRHSISHTRKWLKPMTNQNGIDSYCGSLYRHNFSYRQ
jgi:hypothetical protein